jgi:two-component system cell cycle sensor histidine kinase/response regulator CckA
MPLSREQEFQDDAVRREVVELRAQVAGLHRAAARHEDTESVSLAEREELLREAEGIAQFGTWTWDIGSGRVTWSDQMYRILDLDPAEVAPSVEVFFMAVHPEDRERAQAASEQGIKDGVLPPVDCRIVRPDGSIRHTTSSGVYLFDADGNPRRVVGGLRDRTQSLRAESKMRRTLMLLEEAQSLAQLGSWRFRPESGELEWSSEFRRIAGLSPDVTPAMGLFFDRIHPEDVVAFRERWVHALRDLQGSEADVRLQRPNGEIRHVRLNGASHTGLDGRIELRGTMLDVTDQVRLREELAHAQKMEAVGRLAGGIAHDFNNLLTIVMGNLELLSAQMNDTPELDDSLRALNSAAGLTRRLLAFGRKARLSLKNVDPNQLVRSTMDLMLRLVGDEVRLEVDLASELPPVSLDFLEIERALMNLVANARDAMPSGGVVRITTKESLDNGVRNVELSVEDEGPGISEEDWPHIFEPFYTTRLDAGGTGLGLATVLGTAEQHGGTVRVTDGKFGGAVFTMILPAAKSEAAPVSPPVAVSASTRAGRKLRLLIVDDEPMVADVAHRMLLAQGHDVRVASRPEEAMEIWVKQGRTIDLVVCDVAMAQMRGPQLVQRLAELGVTPRVLFITGYSEEAVTTELGFPVLSKPFTGAALIDAIGSALNLEERG